MIVEERIYTLHPGQTKPYLDYYEQEGLAIQREYLPNLLGYYSTEFGPLNQVIHLWGYDSLADRAERRAALAAEPAWQRVLATQRARILTQENKLLTPAAFSPPILR